MTFEVKSAVLSPEDFKLDGPVKWCPGCGGHAVLSAIMKALPETNIKKENVVFVSGINHVVVPSFSSVGLPFYSMQPHDSNAFGNSIIVSCEHPPLAGGQIFGGVETKCR